MEDQGSQRDLHPLSDEEAANIPINKKYGPGPFTVKDPAFAGPTDFCCPQCHTVLFEKTNESGIATVTRIDCYVCGRSSSGAELAG